jgi:hypothetical protein
MIRWCSRLTDGNSFTPIDYDGEALIAGIGNRSKGSFGRSIGGSASLQHCSTRLRSFESDNGLGRAVPDRIQFLRLRVGITGLFVEKLSL